MEVSAAFAGKLPLDGIACGLNRVFVAVLRVVLFGLAWIIFWGLSEADFLKLFLRLTSSLLFYYRTAFLRLRFSCIKIILLLTKRPFKLR